VRVAATIQMLLNLMYINDVLAMLTIGERTAEREWTTDTLKDWLMACDGIYAVLPESIDMASV